MFAKPHGNIYHSLLAPLPPPPEIYRDDISLNMRDDYYCVAGCLGFMCSYNSIRGVPACANYRSMNTWARHQWGWSRMENDRFCVYGLNESF